MSTNNLKFYAHPNWFNFVQQVSRAANVSTADATQALRQYWNPYNINQSIQEAIDSFVEERQLDNWADAVMEVAYQTNIAAFEAAVALRRVWNPLNIEGSVDRAISSLRGPIPKG